MNETYDSETSALGDESTVAETAEDHFLYDIQTCANWANFIYFNQVPKYNILIFLLFVAA